MKSRLPQGYGGGGAGNMQQMIKQAQKMQEEMAKKSAELEEIETTVTAGGGAVVISGKKVIKAISLKPEIVDPEDIEMLQDLIISGVNEAIRTVEELSNKEMEKISGGLNVPGMF
ncbi:MAG: YbaB/EbfC family nucleoid-associated protein [Hydrogenoanaerobacterium sp.]